MILGFSTLGQPELSFAQCDQLAIDFDLDFIELRVLEGTLDLPEYFQSRRTEDNKVPVRVLGTSLQLLNCAPPDIEEFLRFSVLAARLRTPYVRIFGGGKEGVAPSPQDIDRVVATVGQIRKRLMSLGLNIEMLLETHGAFAQSSVCQELNIRLSEPINLLWDCHHTWRFGHESPDETWNYLGPRIRHIHYKDSIESVDAYRYVLPGTGRYPGDQLMDLLKRKGYGEGISLEWEKLWHPELAPLREALKAFIQVIRDQAGKGPFHDKED